MMSNTLSYKQNEDKMSLLEVIEQLNKLQTRLELLDINLKHLGKTMYDAMDKHSAIIIAELSKSKPSSSTQSITSFTLFERWGTLSPNSPKKYDEIPDGNFNLR